MLFRTRWIKIMKDIWGNRSRSLLVILSITVGVAAVGMINIAGGNLQRDLYQSFAAGNPSVLEVYASPFQLDLAQAVEGSREVELAEARRVLGVSLHRGDDRWEDLGLVVYPDYQDIMVNQLSLESGSMMPEVRELILERQSAQALGLSVGDSVTVETSSERRYELTVSGVVHDIYVRPFSLLGEATGYVSMDTLRWMGEAPYYNRLDIVVSGDRFDRDHVLEVGDLIRDRIAEPSGYQVARVQIPGIGSDPGEHWAQDQIKGFLLILQIMGVIAVLLSGGLVVNTVSAILSQQVKQIGIMRSVGATRNQIVGMYLFNVLIYSLFGLILAIPLGLLGAWGLVEFAANFLNFDVSRISLPLNVLALQLGLGLIMPVAVALIPVIGGTGLSVYDAIYQYGLSSDEGGGLLEGVLSRIRALSPAMMLSLRNTFRKKARLAFTLVTLTLAGAMFMAVFSTRASLTAQINEVGRYIAYDAALRVSGGLSQRAVEREALRVPGVNVAESWANGNGVIVDAEGRQSEELEIVGLPFNSATVDPLLLDGVWLQRAGAAQIVVNDDLTDRLPEIGTGSQIALEVGGRKHTLEVIGVVSKHLSGPRVYMDEDTFGKVTGRYNQADQVRVLATPDGLSDAHDQKTIAMQLEERFKNAGLSSSSGNPRYTFLERFTGVFDIILIVLVIMAALLAVVGGLGLTGSMGINVLERTREIGVLRAVGASNFTVRQVVVVEGVVVGVISWILSAILSGPTGRLLAGAVIEAVLQADLSFRYSLTGLLIWLAIVVLIGVLSSLAPARKAVSLRVREVLDYE
jgi:putative ABC transport system permease protein